MASLISLYRDDGQCNLGRRELALPFDENIAVCQLRFGSGKFKMMNVLLQMVMKLPELNLSRLPSCHKPSEQELFVDKKKLLTATELNEALCVSCQEVLELIGPNVPCVGCRRRFPDYFLKNMLNC